MRRRLVTHGVCLFVGAVVTLALVLWLQRGLRHAVAAEGQGAGTPSGNGDVNGDGTIDISDGVYILNWLFLGGKDPVAIECPQPEVKGPPATGQTKCCGIVGDNWTEEVPCDQAACQGQDGQYAAGCPSEGRFVDNGDGTVTDNCTGLMWQKDTADVNGDGLIDENDGTLLCDALAYSEGLTLAGHSDWRLPNVRELQSIVDYGRLYPAIDPVFGGVSDNYMSSTTYVLVPGYPRFVSFHDGSISGSFFGMTPSVLRAYVRAVRGGL